MVVVGAGAVGQSYAAAAARGGAEVAFRVRRPTGPVGRFTTYRLGQGRPERSSFEAPLLGTDAAVAAYRPDVLLLTVPSDALRAPGWLPPLLGAAPDALVIALEPTPEDAEVVRAARPGVRLARGMIALVAYHAPLPGEEVRFPVPGVAVWAPVRCPFAGPPDARPDLEAFASALRRGGLRTRVVEELDSTSAFGSIALATWITALRAAGWRFAALAETAALGRAAVREGTAVVAARLGAPPPWWTAALGPRAVRAGLAAASRVVSFPLETYLRVHFTKVGAQTRLLLTEAIADGEARGLPVGAVRALLAAADARPSAA